MTDPDTMQFVKKEKSAVFLLKQFDSLNYNLDDELHLLGEGAFLATYWGEDIYWNEDTIDLDSVSKEEKIEAIKSYGYSSMEELIEMYGDDANQIIAEILFELSLI